MPTFYHHTHAPTATFKLLRAVGIGFAVSLFFGTIPFLDLLQLPEKGGALGWAVYTAAYLWAMLALLRFGKLNMDQPFSVLPDNSELAAEVLYVCLGYKVSKFHTFCWSTQSLRGNTPGMATFAMLNAAADGILYRGALLTSVAVWGDLLVSGDAAYAYVGHCNAINAGHRFFCRRTAT